MTPSIHALAIDAFAPMLHTLSTLLDRGAEKLGPTAMVEARLAPDMYPLAKQVQIACYQAADAAARLTGQPARALEMPPETLEQLKQRIAATIAALRAIPAEAFAGAEARRIENPLGTDLLLELDGWQYLRDWSLPQFYFHVVTAYNILRHHGVEIGKRDFMHHVGPAIRPRS